MRGQPWQKKAWAAVYQSSSPRAAYGRMRPRQDARKRTSMGAAARGGHAPAAGGERDKL